VVHGIEAAWLPMIEPFAITYSCGPADDHA